MSNTVKSVRFLIVDDEDDNVILLSRNLKKTACTIAAAKNGREAILKAIEFKPDLIFLDIKMPLMDGYEVCRILKNNPDTRHIPILVMTLLEDQASKLKALEAGANDFITKPCDSAEVTIRTRNLLRLKEFEDFLQDHARRLEAEVEKKTAGLNAAIQEIDRTRNSLKDSYLDTIHRITFLSEYKDEATASHIKRVGMYSAHIAKQLGWTGERLESIRYASLLHDVGKVAIPSDILLKPYGLTEGELALVKTHTTVGGKILHGSKSAILQMAEQIAINHHERWDGSGYPSGRKGENIPIEARITALADQYDSLRSIRPYKPPFDYVLAYRIIVEGNKRMKPSYFDPRLIEVFRDTHKVFEEIHEQNKDEPVLCI